MVRNSNSIFDKLDVYNYNCFQIQHQDSDLQMLLVR